MTIESFIRHAVRDSIANTVHFHYNRPAMDKQERQFWRVATLIFALFVGLFYFPVLLGKIPFPRDMVLQFPAWAGRIRSEGSVQISH